MLPSRVWPVNITYTAQPGRVAALNGRLGLGDSKEKRPQLALPKFWLLALSAS